MNLPSAAVHYHFPNFPQCFIRIVGICLITSNTIAWAQNEVLYDANTATLMVPKAIYDGDVDELTYLFNITDNGDGIFQVTRLEETSTAISGREHEVIYYPDTGTLFMPRAVFANDLAGPAFAVTLVDTGEFNFVVTSALAVGSGPIYYIRPNHPGASDFNSGLSPILKDNADGPWASLLALSGKDLSNATVFLGSGTYQITELSLDFNGMSLLGLPDESPVIDGGNTDNVWALLASITDKAECTTALPGLISQFTEEQQSLFGEQNNIHISADDVTVEGLEIRNSLHYNILITGDRAIVRNNIIHNSQEDNIKITDVVGGLIEGNEVFDALNEQVDMIFGQDVLILNNNLHSTRDIPCGRSGHGAFAKGGARNIIFEGNEIYNILSAPNNGALGLGGGGGGEGVQFQEKDEDGNYFPIGNNIVARNNYIHDVNQAAIGFLGCGNCIAENNTIDNAIVGTVIRHGIIDETDIDPVNGEIVEVDSFNATIRNNSFTNINYISLFETTSMEGIDADNNSFTMSSGFAANVIETTGDIKNDLNDPSLTSELQFQAYVLKYGIESNSMVFE